MKVFCASLKINKNNIKNSGLYTKQLENRKKNRIQTETQ